VALSLRKHDSQNLDNPIPHRLGAQRWATVTSMMEYNYNSRVERTDKFLRFRCGDPAAEPAKRVSVECVLDSDGLGNIVGVEIINLRLAAGQHMFRGCPGNSVSFFNGTRFSYDDEVDAFYLYLCEGRSLDQRVEDCDVLLDEHGTFIGLEITLGG